MLMKCLSLLFPSFPIVVKQVNKANTKILPMAKYHAENGLHAKPAKGALVALFPKTVVALLVRTSCVVSMCVVEFRFKDLPKLMNVFLFVL